MSKRNIFSLCVLFAALVILLAFVVLPVAGQAPSNDDRLTPTVIGSLPFSQTQDTAEATTALDDPYVSCNGFYGYPSATVWYTLTPSEELAVSLSTSGSDYYPVLVVLNSSGSQIACTTGSSLIIQLEAGTMYTFMIGEQMGGGYPGPGFGGTLVFSVDVVAEPDNDDFDNAAIVEPVPYSHAVDLTASTGEFGEPIPSCNYNNVRNTAWYAFTPDDSGSYSVELRNQNFVAFVAAYTGAALNNLDSIGCRISYGSGDLLTIEATVGTTYYYQIGNVYTWDNPGPIQFHLDFAPPPVADFGFWPSDPTVFEEVHFNGDYSYDPANIGISDHIWDFGDGETAVDCCPDHHFPSDGEYTVELAVVTIDGRTATTSRVIEIDTHDLAITKFQTPKAAKAGQTRQISVGILNHQYPERATVRLYRSVPDGLEYLGSWTQEVPVRSGNRTTDFEFSYTFTEADAIQGKVTFKAIVDLHQRRDALPADNEAISTPTKVNR
jgi:hypothetical protein